MLWEFYLKAVTKKKKEKDEDSFNFRAVQGEWCVLLVLVGFNFFHASFIAL